MKRVRCSLARFGGDESGIAAVEFAIVAPVLVFMLLGMMDIGFAVSKRMALDSAVRAGAEAVVLMRTREEVAAIVTETSRSHFGANDTPTAVAVVDATCDASIPCYDIQASRTYSGIFLDDLALQASMLVEVPQ